MSGMFPLKDLSHQCIVATLQGQPHPLRWNLRHFDVDLIAGHYRELVSRHTWQVRLLDPEQTIEAIRFILNELVENALKYNHSGSINITVNLKQEYFICTVSNQVPTTLVPLLRNKFMKLDIKTVEDAFNRQVEVNFQETGKNQSGLGLLLLQKDYQVNLSWEFTSLLHNLACLKTSAIYYLNQGETHGN